MARRGFTLVEVLIAVGVFTVAFGGVFAVLAAGAESRRRAEDGTEASLIATSLVAEARARFREPGPLPTVSGRPWPTNPRYAFSLDYIQLDKAGDEVFMRVRVRWLRGGSGRHLDFDTILLRKLD
jgi:prepilin-type N-terminal cleavage/methylation domain-containing protein